MDAWKYKRTAGRTSRECKRKNTTVAGNWKSRVKIMETRRREWPEFLCAWARRRTKQIHTGQNNVAIRCASNAHTHDCTHTMLCVRTRAIHRNMFFKVLTWNRSEHILQIWFQINDSIDVRMRIEQIMCSVHYMVCRGPRLVVPHGQNQFRQNQSNANRIESVRVGQQWNWLTFFHDYFAIFHRNPFSPRSEWVIANSGWTGE